jgi:creatinine amidohydrolase/Fe(II)-dependent formamide hydrolase-like protein
MRHHLRHLFLLYILLLAPSGAARAQTIDYVAQMNTEQIKTLDRSRTVVLLPGGILEQHGPYLPSFTDGYANEWLTQQLAEAIVKRPGWNVLIFPTVPLGVGGANEIGRKYVFPGTYAVRSATLRAVFIDLATELGEQGFRWVFIIHAHGAPNHNRMLDQAGDYFRDTYGGHMVHLMGLMPVFGADAGTLTEAEKKENGFSVHAGAGETSDLLFLRPDLVSRTVLQARPQTARDWEELVRIARAPQWPGYFGSPRLATAEKGARESASWAGAATEYALKILDGLDERQIPRFSSLSSKSPANVAIDRDALVHEQRIQRREQAWLRKHGLR